MGFLDQLSSARRFERAYIGHLVNRLHILPWPGAPAELEQEWIEPRGWSAALARDPRVVCTGTAGQGKTTALAYLALSNARALLAGSKQAHMPIFLSARDLAPSALPRITDFPRGLLVPDPPRGPVPAHLFSRSVRLGPCARVDRRH